VKAEAKEEPKKVKDNVVKLTEKYINFIDEFHSAARNFTGEQISKAAERIKVTLEELKEFAAKTQIVENVEGDIPVDNTAIMTSLIPIAHIFKIFVGYDVVDVLREPM